MGEGRLRVPAGFLLGFALLLATSSYSHDLASDTAQPAAVYTVTLQEVLTTVSGTTRVVAIETQALRQDGATVLQLGAPGETGRQIRLPAGWLIETNDQLKRKSTFRMPPATVAAHIRDPHARCARDTEQVQSEEMVGAFRAAKVASRTGGSTRWYALDHSCALVRSVTDHPGGSRSEKALIAFTPTADARLFEAEGFAEGRPSLLEGTTPCDAACEQRRQRRDAEYDRLRPGR